MSYSYTWTYLESNPKQSKRLIGINYENFIQLIQSAKKINEIHQENVSEKKTLLIRPGVGAKPKLLVEDQILLTLIYLRQCLTFQMLGVHFHVSESTAYNYFSYWQDILSNALPPSLIEHVKNNGENEDELSQLLNEYELIVDSEEQAIPRPKDYEEQKKFYSGKKKYHSLKNQFIVLPGGADIVDVVPGERGPKSDINIWRERKDIFNSEQKFAGDQAYIGESQIKTPHKKPKKQELTAEQKEENQEFSSLRVFVEHAIRLVKIFRVAGERFRLKPDKYNSGISTYCGLVRLRR
ncbi:MAG: transposase family protein [Hormoscilla sp. GM7CHS1pb]|nr:transposase family protein [Hormoscilla sp. GM7CHS1pb]